MALTHTTLGRLPEIVGCPFEILRGPDSVLKRDPEQIQPEWQLGGSSAFEVGRCGLLLCLGTRRAHEREAVAKRALRTTCLGRSAIPAIGFFDVPDAFRAGDVDVAEHRLCFGMTGASGLQAEFKRAIEVGLAAVGVAEQRGSRRHIGNPARTRQVNGRQGRLRVDMPAGSRLLEPD